MIIVHDKLLEYGGAEFVLRELVVGLRPDYVFSPCVDDIEKWQRFYGCSIKTIKIFRFINSQRRYRMFYPVLALVLLFLKIKAPDGSPKLYYSSSLGKYVNFTGSGKCFLYSNFPFKGVVNTKSYLKNASVVRALLVMLLVSPMRALEKLALKKFERLSVISESAKQAYETNLSQRVDQVIHCPVDVRNLSVINTPRHTGTKNILIICRLYVEKGVEAVLQLLHDMEGISTEVIGDGPELEYYRKLFPNISFLGFVDEEVKIVRMQEADILINPTAQEWSLTTVEANCSGRAVLSAKCDAIAEINRCISGRSDGPNLVFQSDLSDLKGALNELKPLTDKLRENALEFFSPIEFTNKIRSFVYD